MNVLLLVAVQNTVAALVFALFVHTLTRVIRNPPLAHALWLLVLLKLATPPLMTIHWPIRQSSVPTVANAPAADDDKAAGQVATSSTFRAPTAPVIKTPAVTVGIRELWTRAAPVVFWCWLGGTAVCAWLAAIRMLRFERAVRQMLPASESLQRLARETGDKLGVRRVPEVRCAEGVEVPLLWCVVRPTIVLPTRLTHELDQWQINLILAHELAHMRRYDHRVRVLELLAAILYWWNPVVWLVRRQIHQAEELCCDAWVGWTFPEERKHYAEVVLKAAESLNVLQVGRRPLAASPFLRCLSLKERIEMILESRFRPRVSLTSKFVIAVAAIAVLPTFVRFSKAEAAPEKAAGKPATTATAKLIKIDSDGAIEMDDKAVSSLASLAELLAEAKKQNADVKALILSESESSFDRVQEVIKLCSQAGITKASVSLRSYEYPAEESEAALSPPEKPETVPSSPQFPYVVKFEQGATKFLEGDKITIVEVRGTAETFKPGDIYWIKGTYSLASHDQATLAAYTTAKHSADARSRSFTAQTTRVNKGSGTFTLFLPMACEGWPHVSFYPADGGEGFGGNYFGTGDTVLKRWWGEKNADASAK